MFNPETHNKSPDWLAFVIISSYFSIGVFGNFLEFSQSETSIGLSTVLILLIIAFKAYTVPRSLLQEPLFLSLLVLLLWCALSSIFAPAGFGKAYVRLAQIFGYLFAAVAVYQTVLTETRARILLYGLGISITIASAMTIIDYLGVYDFPYVNETDITTKIGQQRVEQAGGFFLRRSAMAAFYSLIIPALFYYALKTENITEKLFMLGASGISYIALFLTHNRSGVLAIAIALVIFVLIDNSVRYTRKASIIGYTILAFCVVGFIVYVYFPEHLDVYVMKLNRYLPGGGIEMAEATAQSVVQADESRVYFFVSVLQSLVSNPLGNGFSPIYTERYGFGDPHNIIAYLIWAAGVMAFVWIPVFIYLLFRSFALKNIVEGSVVRTNLPVLIGSFQVGLLSWGINNLAHNSLHTGLAWMYLGLILNLIRMVKSSEMSATVHRHELRTGIIAGDPTADGGRLKILREADNHTILKKRSD